MTFQELLDYYNGSMANAGRALNLTYQCVNRWSITGYIPLLQQHKYAEITNGELKVTPEEIPDYAAWKSLYYQQKK